MNRNLLFLDHHTTVAKVLYRVLAAALSILR